MSTVSRRSFLTGSAALASAAAVGIAGFSASTAQASEASGPSGTYTATAKGFAGDVTVTATFENGTLTDLEAQGPSETPDRGGVACEELPAQIVEANGTAAVDAKSGATVTSRPACSTPPRPWS